MKLKYIAGILIMLALIPALYQPAEGYYWGEEELMVYTARTIPTIDGQRKPGEWGDAPEHAWTDKDGYPITDGPVNLTLRLKHNSTHLFLLATVNDNETSTDPFYMNDSLILHNLYSDDPHFCNIIFSNGTTTENGYFLRSGPAYNGIKEINGSAGVTYIQSQGYTFEVAMSLSYLNITSNNTTSLAVGYFDGIDEDEINNYSGGRPFYFYEVVFLHLTLSSHTYSLIPSIELSNPDPHEGEKILIYAALQNTGTSGLSNVSVNFFDGNIPIGNRTISTIPSGANVTTLPIEWTAGPGGNHTLRVISGGQEASIEILVIPLESRPVISELYFSANPVLKGQEVELRVRVCNEGTLESSEMTLVFQENSIKIDEISVESIGPGNERTAFLNWRFEDEGSHEIRVILYEDGVEKDSVSRDIYVVSSKSTTPSFRSDIVSLILITVLATCLGAMLRKS